MQRILKYEIEPDEHGTIIAEGKIVSPLSVGWQDDKLMLWAEVKDPNPALPLRQGGLLVVPAPTGGDVPPAGFAYIGTAATGGPASIFGGPMVMHVYGQHLR